MSEWRDRDYVEHRKEYRERTEADLRAVSAALAEKDALIARLRAENERLTAALSALQKQYDSANHSLRSLFGEDTGAIAHRAMDAEAKLATAEARALAAEAREAKAVEDMRERAAAYHEDLAAQHEAALTDGDAEGNAWHLAQSVAHRRHAAAIRALPTEVQNDA